MPHLACCLPQSSAKLVLSLSMSRHKAAKPDQTARRQTEDLQLAVATPPHQLPLPHPLVPRGGVQGKGWGVLCLPLAN